MRALLVFWLLLFAHSPAAADDWRDADLGGGVREGFATQNDLWLLGWSGKVVRFERRTGNRQVVAAEVKDILPNGGRLWALISQTDGASYVIRDLRDGSQESMPSHDDARRLYLHPGEDSEGETIAMVAWPEQYLPAVATQRALIIPTPTGWKRQLLAATLNRLGHAAATGNGDVYVGYNRGEWGGGLRRIAASGAISFVTEGSEDLCGGAINPACEPVVGVYSDPDRPGCVMVGTGLSHMGMSFGRVYRVCEGAISSVFTTPAPSQPDQWMMTPQPWPFDGFSEVSHGWIGLSRDRYFRSRNGAVSEHPMPAFQDWSGIRISEEKEGVLFVVSACCWGIVDNPTLYRAIAVPIEQ